MEAPFYQKTSGWDGMGWDGRKGNELAILKMHRYLAQKC